jgi:hypothetical protein
LLMQDGEDGRHGCRLAAIAMSSAISVDQQTANKWVRIAAPSEVGHTNT